MNISLETWLRDKLSETEMYGQYEIGTDTVRAWIDLYNDLKIREPDLKFYCWDEDALGVGSRCKIECDICKNKGKVK